MSHFTVLVPAKDEEELEAKLLPYHEYECTGIEEYLEFIPADMEELQARYEEHGNGEDFEAFVEGWSGDTKNENGVYGRMTNPNAKWDWWTIGGRWTGALAVDYDPYEDPANKEPCWLCHGTGDRPGWVYYEGGERKFKDDWAKECNGCNLCKGTGISVKFSSDWRKHDMDTPLVGWVDWQAILQKQADAAVKKYDTHYNIAHELYGYGARFHLWRTVVRLSMWAWQVSFSKRLQPLMRVVSRKRLRELVNRADKEVLAKLSEQGIFSIDSFDWGKSRESLIAEESGKALTFAFITQDGEWVQSAEMGWWACTSDPNDSYDETFWEFIKDLPQDQRIYIVDCHI
jgi:hypothetical protein